MNIDMRRKPARQLFEEKIRKLIKLSAIVESSRVRDEAQMTQHQSRTRAHIAEANVESKL
jgi:hypothetical protein